MKNKLILLIISVLLVAGFIYLGERKEEAIIEEPNLPVIETPEVIVGENLEGEADPSVMKLDMTTWRWYKALYNDDTNIVVKSPEKFTLTFNNDGTFSATTDCNGGGGKYKVTGNQIEFSEMMRTLMFCTESQETEFYNILENTSSFLFTSRGELILEQKFNSGTATFR